jgi:sensor domain CHASE-containing protein
LTLLNRGKTNSLAKNKDVWSDEDGDQELNQDQVSCRLIWNHLISELELSWKNKWKTVTTHPYIPFVTLVCLAVLLSISIITTVQLNNAYRAEKELQVKDLALDTGRWFSEQLNKVVSPLFTLREFVKEMPIFHDLPHLIGQGGEPGSAPYLNGTVIKFRNVSGICDNTTVGAAFDRISKSIRDHSNAKSAIVALNIGPQDVACYFYPLNNTEDFTPPLYFDNSGAVGLDLLKDPTRTAVMVKTHQSDGFTVAGPMPLTQCASCPPAVRVGFIARLPVNMPGYNIYAGGVNYTSWGFVAAVLNWDKLLQQTDFPKRFEEDYGLQFELSKTDRILNTSTNQFYEKVRISLVRVP